MTAVEILSAKPHWNISGGSSVQALKLKKDPTVRNHRLPHLRSTFKLCFISLKKFTGRNSLEMPHVHRGRSAKFSHCADTVANHLHSKVSINHRIRVFSAVARSSLRRKSFMIFSPYQRAHPANPAVFHQHMRLFPVSQSSIVDAACREALKYQYYNKEIRYPENNSSSLCSLRLTHAMVLLQTTACFLFLSGFLLLQKYA